MMQPEPEPASEPSAQIRLARLIVELNKMRDALVELSWQMRDHLYAQESTQRNEARAQSEQAIQRAKAMACQSPRRP